MSGAHPSIARGGRATRQRNRDDQRGALLVVTLWLVVICATFALTMARRVSHEIRLSTYERAKVQARALARSGVYLALAQLQRDQLEDTVDWSGDDWALPQQIRLPNTGELHVTVTDEERKLNLQAVAEPVLGLLLGGSALATEIATKIVQYRATLPGPILALEELAHLDGMDPERSELLRAQTSPYTSPTELLNLNTATRDVLRALRLPLSAVETLERLRARGHVFDDPGTVVSTLETYVVLEDAERTVLVNLMNHVGVASHTFSVVAEGMTERPQVRVRVWAIVRRAPTGTESPRLIAWREG